MPIPKPMPSAEWSVFPIGEPNVAYSRFFVGRAYLHTVSTSQVAISAVTFEPGCRNNWHVHHARSGGGQILVCTAGRGFYQAYGDVAVELKPGDSVNIPSDMKHWHGAAPDSWFQHLVVEVPGVGCSTEWLDAVDDATYAEATGA